jgi:hypothetical protein
MEQHISNPLLLFSNSNSGLTAPEAEINAQAIHIGARPNTFIVPPLQPRAIPVQFGRGCAIEWLGGLLVSEL